MEKKNETAVAKYNFTDEEKIEKGIELTDQMSKKRGFEAVVRLNKSLIKKTESDIAALEAKVSNGFEFREFACDVEFDFENKKRLYRSLDTGEIIKETPLKAEDYQLKMLEDEKVEKTRQRDELFAKNGVGLTRDGEVMVVVGEAFQAVTQQTQEEMNVAAERLQDLQKENFKKWEEEELAKQKKIRSKEEESVSPDPAQ